jgi:hypothetical protein
VVLRGPRRRLHCHSTQELSMCSRFVVWATATPPPMAFSRPVLRSKPADLEYVPTARAGHEHSAEIICCVSGSRLRPPKATTQAQAIKLSAQGPWQSLMFLLLQRCSACCVGPLLDHDQVPSLLRSDAGKLGRPSSYSIAHRAAARWRTCCGPPGPPPSASPPRRPAPRRRPRP